MEKAMRYNGNGRFYGRAHTAMQCLAKAQLERRALLKVTGGGKSPEPYTFILAGAQAAKEQSASPPVRVLFEDESGEQQIGTHYLFVEDAPRKGDRLDEYSLAYPGAINTLWRPGPWMVIHTESYSAEPNPPRRFSQVICAICTFAPLPDQQNPWCVSTELPGDILDLSVAGV
jgi:hypothetical protein